jgi:hypothetical protein
MRDSNLRLCLVSALGGALLAIGCSSSNGSASTPESQTLIQIVPDDFVAKGTCGNPLMSYVATLFDFTGPAGLSDAGVSAQSFVVATSPPKGCTESTVFSSVAAGHAYMVELHGYKQSRDEYHSADSGSFSGSSAMLLNSDDSYLAPAWNANCYGWRDRNGVLQPGYAYAYATMTLSTCSLLGSEP